MMLILVIAKQNTRYRIQGTDCAHALEDTVDEWLPGRCRNCGAKDTFSREFDVLHR